MRSFLTWSDKVQDQNGVRQPIWDLSFHPDGTQLIVTAGSEILVYSIEGELIQSLKSHKNTVYCVDYSIDGARFVSGSADKNVIIWNAITREGILKYSHNDPIQAIAHNPVTDQVLSCSASDFGIWSSESKNVNKVKVNSRILTAAWCSNGQSFALGLYNGVVSIRTKSGEETVKIDRGKNIPVWAISWNKNPEKDNDIIAVTDWNQKLSFFQPNGKQIGKERHLGFDPCSVSFSYDTEYLVVGGSDKKVQLWTPEGIKIGLVCEKDQWIWCCKVKPKQNYVAVGCNDGTISIYQLVFNTVHGLFNDRYAFRENLTDVVIQHLVTDQRARIKCRDHVKKISVYKDRLAVQLPDRIIVYELFHDDATDMHYRIREKIPKKLDCNLLVVTSLHIILCKEKTLQMFNFSGEKEREWNLDAVIRYIKVFGGSPGREGLLVGLKNGHILQIFLDNHFPMLLMKQSTAVRCLDINLARNKLAVVDDQNTCLVYDLDLKDLIYQEPNANSVAWNTEMEDILCFAGNGTLNVKAGMFPAQQQKMPGFVVGFKGARVFSLQTRNMSVVDVPYSLMLERYMEKGDFVDAYKLACLGATEGDWRKLALESLQGLNWEISKKCFIRLRELKFIDLIQTFENAKAEGVNEDVNSCLAEILALSEKYHEAAKFYKQAGNFQKAIDMYTQLNMWDFATKIALESDISPTEILKMKAKMQFERNDLLAAAATYTEVGMFNEAIDILGPNGWLDNLIEVARKLNKSETKALSRCVYFFKNHNHHSYAAECLVKMGDIQNLLKLHIELLHWDEAFRLAETRPQFNSEIFLPYANWLAMNDRFVEAQLNYQKAGRLDVAFRVLQQLTQNAISEKRYEDGAYYFWTLSMQHCDSLPSDVELEALTVAQRKTLEDFHTYYELSEVYYAYHFVQRYMDEPFTSHLTESLFNMALFVLDYLNKKPAPQGVSRVYVLFALAKLSRVLGAFKTARYAYETLQSCVIPSDWVDLIELGTMTVRSKPTNDRQELMPVCYGCGTLHPLTTATTNTEFRCTYCLEPFIHSFYSFDTLPLVQFVLEPDINPEEAQRLINTPKPTANIPGSKNRPTTSKSKRMTKEVRGDQSEENGGLAGNVNGFALRDDDPFNRALLALERDKTGKHIPVVLNRKEILSLGKHLVFVKKWGKKCLPDQYYCHIQSNDNHDVGIKLCNSCNHFFFDDEWCYQLLQKGVCPFCRVPQELS
ncbi:hypothetical protein HK099_004014 [Clydaea vesicula]|uniref:Intraflagellar transport protein 122 homolog n=1 Tax=Clydaea vesicula TaxID=447962 RepID=A0AAD5U0T1_9FUNG|nr:hypothetical protein HK099_004014 [Clydaea vesicula]